MTKTRAGYHNLGLQLPAVVWDALCAEAEEKGQSVTRVLAEVLRRHYRIPADQIPPPGRPGRKPKREGAGDHPAR